MVPFDIDVSDPLRPKVRINGEDVSDLVQRVTVDVGVGSDMPVPKVYLEMRGNGVLHGEGVVHTVRSEPADPVGLVRAWLDAIDPDELERRVLAGTWDSSTGQAFLDELKAMT